MRIHRSILDYDMFRHPYTEGGKIPKSLDSSLDNPVCHLLRFLHRHGDHPDRRAIFFLLGRKVVDVKNRNAIYKRVVYFRPGMPLIMLPSKSSRTSKPATISNPY